MAMSLQQQMDQVLEGIRRRAFEKLLASVTPGVIDLDEPIHADGIRCCDVYCPCQRDPEFTDRPGLYIVNLDGMKEFY